MCHPCNENTSAPIYKYLPHTIAMLLLSSLNKNMYKYMYLYIYFYASYVNVCTLSQFKLVSLALSCVHSPFSFLWNLRSFSTTRRITRKGAFSTPFSCLFSFSDKGLVESERFSGGLSLWFLFRKACDGVA